MTIGTIITYEPGKTKALPWRKQQLRQIQQLIKDNYETLAQAIVSDYSGPKIRAFAELGAFNEAQDAIDNLDCKCLVFIFVNDY